ncbi:uncharacterized protein LOC110704970 [Chenopodium quinoa]|uniref:uncharacterized protein LOC110704970 n=1 Tax=Chenopodium quinoa TaxID=63459 RepID=UPI000B777CF4|nr:uncharacterized protein LOC110704970 [Chenopodium quinoa]
MAGDDVPPPPPPPEIKPNSPFYLGSQDRPGDFITPTRLKSDNYDDWAADVQTALEARRKFVFLDGSINAPISPCTQSDWTALNAMLISWITNIIDPEVRSSLSKFREAKSLWEHLKKRFAQTNGPRIQQLRSSIAKCEQSRSMSVSVYYGKLHSLWQELDHHEPLLSCSCCSKCIAGQLDEARREKSKLHDFLMGLYPDFYASLWSNILSQDPLPSLDRAYQLAVQEERVRAAKLEQEQTSTEAVGFAVHAAAGRGYEQQPSDRGKAAREGQGSVCFLNARNWVMRPHVAGQKKLATIARNEVILRQSVLTFTEDPLRRMTARGGNMRVVEAKVQCGPMLFQVPIHLLKEECSLVNNGRLSRVCLVTPMFLIIA